MEGLSPDALHHTYIISGDREHAFSAVLEFIEKDCGVTVLGNQDVFAKTYDSFYIDDARGIRDLQQHTTLDTTQFFVLSMKEITHQAQNALLKITEDPTTDTCFFVLVPNHQVLLPTLLSRAVLIEYKSENNEYRKTVQEFVDASVKERLQIIEPFHPKNKEGVDKEKIGQFLSALETAIRDRQALHDVYDVKKKLQARGVSVKTLLEHLAVLLPKR